METYAICVSAIATVVIAAFTGINFWLILTIKSKDNEFRQQVSDLYKAIVISNLMIDRIKDTWIDANITNFTNIYQKRVKGKTPIFD